VGTICSSTRRYRVTVLTSSNSGLLRLSTT